MKIPNWFREEIESARADIINEIFGVGPIEKAAKKAAQATAQRKLFFRYAFNTVGDNSANFRKVARSKHPEDVKYFKDFINQDINKYAEGGTRLEKELWDKVAIKNRLRAKLIKYNATKESRNATPEEKEELAKLKQSIKDDINKLKEYEALRKERKRKNIKALKVAGATAAGVGTAVGGTAAYLAATKKKREEKKKEKLQQERQRIKRERNIH
jgi:methylthioribose-1-phosphate isomerase